MPFKSLTLFLLFLLPITAFAQFTISGSVVNSSDKKPLAGVSIFFNNATFGDATANDGTFKLSNVKNGQYEMIVTAVGYETYTQTLLVNSDVTLPAIELKQKTIVLKEVKIRPNFDREKYYEIFKRQFLGNSDNSVQCKILNPDVLDIDYDLNVLTVSSDKMLEIENKGLGYKIKYLLNTFVMDGNNGTIFFDGYVMFENMTGSKSEQKKWEKNRLNAYLGSQMHFLRSALGNSLEDDGFKVLPLQRTPTHRLYSDSLVRTKVRHYRQLVTKKPKFDDSLTYWMDQFQLPKYVDKLLDTPLTVKDMLKRTDQKIIFALANANCLYVMYTKRKDYYNPMIYHPSDIPKYPITIVNFKSPFLLFDINGGVVNRDAALLEGYWGGFRIADSLPVDYETDEFDRVKNAKTGQ